MKGYKMTGFYGKPIYFHVPGLVYKVGHEYRTDGEPVAGINGYHFHQDLVSLCKYMHLTYWARVFEVDAKGRLAHADEGDNRHVGYATDHIRFLRELQPGEILDGLLEAYPAHELDVQHTLVVVGNAIHNLYLCMNNDFKKDTAQRRADWLAAFKSRCDNRVVRDVLRETSNIGDQDDAI